MQNEKPEETQETAIVSLGETVELIPQPTANLIKKSFVKNTLRNRGHALQKFGERLQGRQITDGLLVEYATRLHNESKAQKQSLLWLPL